MFLAARLRKLMIAVVVSWLAFTAAGFGASARVIPAWVPFVPFAGFFAVVLLMLLWIRCPRCSGPLGQNAWYLNAKNRFYQRRVNFCPNCGVSFDEPLTVSPRSG
jgi:hypothetical protein